MPPVTVKSANSMEETPEQKNLRLKKELLEQLARARALQEDIARLEQGQKRAEHFEPVRELAPGERASPESVTSFFKAECFASLEAEYRAKIDAVYAELHEDLRKMLEPRGEHVSRLEPA